MRRHMTARTQRWEGRVGGWASGVLKFYKRFVHTRELLQIPRFVRPVKLEILFALV